MGIASYPFRPEGTASLAVTNATGRVAMDGGGPMAALVTNTGATIAYIKFGDATVNAAITDMPILSLTSQVFTPPVNATHMAGITASSTTTLTVTSGNGL